MKHEQNINFNNSSNIRIGKISLESGTSQSQGTSSSKKERQEDRSVLKEKVAKHQIEEVIRYLLDECGLSLEESNFLYTVFYRMHALDSQASQGVISSEVFDVERNKIVKALIEFIDQYGTR